MARHRSMFVLAVVGLVLLAGCGGGVDQGTPAPASPTELTTTATTTTSPTTTTRAQTPNGTLTVHFINVGQSVSTLIVGPTGETMLIDTGHYRHDGEYVLQYLRAHNISHLDALVVSHNDADHIGGNGRLIEYYETEANGIGAVYDPGIAASTQTYAAYLDAVETHNVTLYETRAGDRIPFEGVELTVMGPPEPYLENRARNENSIVLKLGFGRTSFLFTGDAEDDQEQYLVESYGQQLDVTILKAGHHGSASSTSAALLDATTPKAVVVSSGWDNQYGHPSDATLQRLAARSIPTYWTATHGNIVLTSDGQQVTVKTQRAAPTAPERLRAGEPISPGATDAVEVRTVIPGSDDTTPTPTRTSTTTTTPTATQTQPTTVADGGADPAALALAAVHADAAGTESENLNDEYVVFENTGGTTLDMGGWTIADSAGHTYTVPDGFTLPAGATVTLHTGSGANTASDLYWGSGRAIWNNGGDTVIVTTDTGQEVLREAY